MTTAREKPELKLSGEDGNVFAIFGAALKAARRAGWSQEKQDLFISEAKSGNYDHAIQTCMKYFDVI